MLIDKKNEEVSQLKVFLLSFCLFFIYLILENNLSNEQFKKLRWPKNPYRPEWVARFKKTDGYLFEILKHFKCARGFVG